MSKRIDITGQLFGNWLVNKYLDDSEYDCTCLLCNRHFRVSGYKLRSGKTGCCTECFNRMKGEKNRDILEGTHIKGWDILSYVGNSTYICKNKDGNISAFTTHQLKHNKEVTVNAKDKAKLPYGKEFGDFTVIGYFGNDVYRCSCHCGNSLYMIGNDMENGIGLSCKKCNSTITKSYNWKADLLYHIKDLNFSLDNDIIKFLNTDVTVLLCDKHIDLDKKAKQTKRLLYYKNNKRLIYIFEHEWKTDDKKHKIIDLLYRAAGANKFKKIYARKLDVITPSTDEIKIFETKYHLQGYSNASINLGFRYNNELIALMTFGHPRFSDAYDYEMIRLVYKNDVLVVGGAEKLFKHFISKFNPSSVVSFCDISKFDGEVYKRLGFEAGSNDLTSPNYCWVNSDCSIALPRYKTMKHKLIKQGLGTSLDTEDSIMIRLGYTKVYDCGNIKFSWYKE